MPIERARPPATLDSTRHVKVQNRAMTVSLLRLVTMRTALSVAAVVMNAYSDEPESMLRNRTNREWKETCKRTVKEYPEIFNKPF